MVKTHFKKHLITKKASVLEALSMLDKLAQDAILFIVDEDNRLVGSLTDGDVRRGLIKGLSLEQSVTHFIQENPKYISKTKYDLQQIIEFRNNYFKIIPIVDEQKKSS
jgi:CBS domain-containing protein